MPEDLNWEHKEELGITKIVDQVNDLSRKVVGRELTEINQKLQALRRMNLIKDCPELDLIKEKMEELNIKE